MNLGTEVFKSSIYGFCCGRRFLFSLPLPKDENNYTDMPELDLFKASIDPSKQFAENQRFWLRNMHTNSHVL